LIPEARSNGTKIVAIFPEFNGSAVHADLFVPVKPGTDGALALAMANVIVNEDLCDRQYIKQFTDMPMLVRKDTGRLLRESDLVSGGSDDRLYLWDTISNQAVQAPGTLGSPNRTLALGSVDPALNGSFTVDGIEVTTVFERLGDKLALHSPDDMAGVTGVNANIIRDIAREFAAASPARIIEGAGTNHYYHNDLINRAQILLVALTGNVGVRGGGFDHYVGQEKLWAEEGFFEFSFPIGRPRQRFQPTTLWTYMHSEAKSDVDGEWPRDVGEYIVDSVNNGWMPLWPKPNGNLTYNSGTKTFGNTRDPKVLFVWGANYLNQAKGNMNVLNTLYPKLDLIVDLNSRMDTTALYADIVLPAASWFEQWNLSTTDLHTFVHPFTPVIPPQYESKTDWQIFQGLAAELASRGLVYQDTVPNGDTITRDLGNLWQDLTDHGALADDRDACQHLLDLSPETNGLTIMNDTADNSIIKHPQRFVEASHDWTSDIEEGKTYFGFQRMTRDERPLTTLAGRQQFYIDHDWYLDEFGEELPVYKPPVDVDQFPLRWITPHGRWSIHSTWRDAKFQLRLQRGRPVVYLSPGEAASRNLEDNELVEVFNLHGSFQAHLYISPRLPNDMALMYHGWEKYFMDNNYQSPTNIRIKPTQIAGGYGQLKFRLNYWGPTGNQKDTRVQIRKLT
jgi:complex iron-sulfur molybdoenzyme family reductase subunit alpha